MKQGKRGKPRLFSDLTITTALMIKRVFSMPLRGLQEFINSIFKLAQLPLSCPHYSCISKRAKTVDVAFQTKTKGTILHLNLIRSRGCICDTNAFCYTTIFSALLTWLSNLLTNLEKQSLITL